MKIANHPFSTATCHRTNRLLRQRLASVAGFAVSACLLMAATSANAGRPFVFTPPPTASMAGFSSPQAANFSRTASTAYGNQALLSGLISQSNLRQAQMSAIAAQNPARNTTFIPQTIRVKSAK